MKYKFKDKELNIPDKEIDVLMKTLDLTEQEAIDTWLADNDYEENEEVEKLTKLAKENKTIQHEAKSDKPRAKRTVVQKDNPLKEEIIETIVKSLEEKGIAAKITNKTKIIEFSVDERSFKIDLVEHRVKKAATAGM